jgi:hypothetical protein
LAFGEAGEGLSRSCCGVLRTCHLSLRKQSEGLENLSSASAEQFWVSGFRMLSGFEKLFQKLFLGSRNYFLVSDAVFEAVSGSLKLFLGL